MRGAVAAGHPLTAAAGARVLEAGGSAVDACVGAAFASWVCESMLTGPGGGGFMLVHGARDGRTRVFDFMVTVPRAAAAAAGELLRLAVDFDGDTQQVFHTGAAAVAVPGTALGLEAAHRRFGRVPWAELVAPAAQLARAGVELTPAQGYLHRILDGLLRSAVKGSGLASIIHLSSLRISFSGGRPGDAIDTSCTSSVVKWASCGSRSVSAFTKMSLNLSARTTKTCGLSVSLA